MARFFLFPHFLINVKNMVTEDDFLKYGFKKTYIDTYEKVLGDLSKNFLIIMKLQNMPTRNGGRYWTCTLTDIIGNTNLLNGGVICYDLRAIDLRDIMSGFNIKFFEYLFNHGFSYVGNQELRWSSMFWSAIVEVKYYIQPGISHFIQEWWNCTIGGDHFSAVNGIKSLERILKSYKLDRIVLEPWESDAKDNRTEI